MSATHLAGNPVVVRSEVSGDRVVQRCLICGEKLADNKNCAMPIEPDGSTPIFPTWAVGAWVQIDGNRSTEISQSESPDFRKADLPDDCCIALVED